VVAVSQTCWPAGQSVFEVQPVGGGAVQVLLEEQTLVVPLQFASLVHWTQEFPDGLTLQTGAFTGQSAPCVAAVQIGTQELLESQRSPAAHWLAAVHWTQVPFPALEVSQCGRRTSLHCASLVHVTLMQRFPAVQTWPSPQSFGQVAPLPHCPVSRQATHLLVPPLALSKAQCGSAVLLAQPESLVQTPVTGAWQV
jgi:hypothetical protein